MNVQENQFDFIQNRLSVEAIYRLRWLIERFKKN